MTVTELLIAILATPLLSAVLIACFFRRQGGVAAFLSVAAAAGICIFSFMAIKASDGATIHVLAEWLRFGDFTVSMGFFFDNVSATMLAMVVFVGFLIHVFSLGYMAKDDARGRFFGGLSIFMFSMLGIILASNLVMIFIFWELVGFSSYMLIAHYFDTKDAKAASKKAFIVNRIGDLGFLVGISYAYWHFGTTDLDAMRAAVAIDPTLINWVIAALLMCGFIGKSAQFPLHVWLPDAMAGPTPVSALIHAATMVAAGVYFLIRIAFLFPGSVLDFIAILGTGVAVYAGFCAYAQNDIKKILAYSTLSQLGYASAVFGFGFPGIALFHLITHAFFKALLFLGAGSVIHGCHHEQDIFKMGGLLKKMPVTSITFLIGMLALLGVNGLSGFFSKDKILIAAGMHDKAQFTLLVCGAFLTAGYMGRLFWIAFFGQPKSDAAKNAHENGFAMLLPLIILAILSITGGWINYWPAEIGDLIRENAKELKHADNYAILHEKVVFWGTAAWIVGLLGSFFFYGAGAKSDRLEQKAGPLFGLLKSRLWFDEIYGYYVGKIQQRFAIFLSFLDVFLIKGILVRGSVSVVALAGVFTRLLHVGSLHAYVYWFLTGLILFWALASKVGP